jgi:outer membrane protein assembly factor BamA
MFVFAAKSTIRPYIYVIAAFSISCFSCRTIKNYPANKPFVYETKINLQDNFSTDERKMLIPQLEGQMHDSIKVRSVRKFVGIKNWVPRFFYTEIVNPPVYDSMNADKTIGFMSATLNSLGYYRDSINYRDTIIKVGDQYRTIIDFNVVSAKLFKLDSISYNLRTDTSEQVVNSPSRNRLQQLTDSSRKETFIKKGDAFSIPTLSQEINRLSDIYRDNGYLRYSNDEMLVLWDTVGIALIRPTLDPIEQAQQLEQLRLRKLSPTAEVEFRLRTNPDTSRLTRYYIGNVKIYPDLNADTSLFYPTFDTIRKYQFISYAALFKPRKLVSFIYLHPGELYRQSNYLKTQNKFNSLTAWRLVNLTALPRPGQDTVDFEVKLTPAKKYQFSANLDGSRNQTPILPQGNLFGLGASIGLQNRNFSRAANLAVTNFRYGIELNAVSGQNSIQTQQYVLSHTITAPRRVPKFNPIFHGARENVRTVFALNLAYTDRFNYYKVRSINTSLGIEKSWKNKLLGIRFPNIEYNFVVQEDSLKKLIETNSSYRYIFNDGLILSTIANFSIAGGKKNTTRLLTLSGEASGLIASLIPSKFLDSNLYRFVKLDVELRETHRIRRSAFAWRVFGGFGRGIPTNNLDSANFFLPFFRQYFAGGPNSMRAWGIRRLGPGSSLRSFAPTDAPDRFGDIRLEANAEYRFYITTVSGVILNGTFFTDVGNVWFWRKNPDFPDGEFRLNKLWKDIAIGTGTGLRVDFSFLKLRFEYAYKVKNPTPDASHPDEQNKWFYNWQWNNGQFQLGIDYPF